MADTRHLARAPITEAIIDLRIDPEVEISDGAREEIENRVGDAYPMKQERRGFETQFRVAGGEAQPPRQRDLGLHGLFFKSEDEKDVVQFRVDGFTVNRLRPYTSWDEIYPEAIRLWDIYKSVLAVEKVTRIGVRFINHLEFDLRNFRPDEHLTVPLVVPKGLPDEVSGFMVAFTVYDDETRDSLREVTSLEPFPSENKVSVLLDIDAFSSDALAATSEAIPNVLSRLRDLKNTAFFGSLTETAIRRYE